MTITATQVDEFGARWAAAEVAGDTETLETMITDDFRLVGPLGFVLDRQQWVDRYRSGMFTTHSLDWHDVSVADHGSFAIAIGIQTQEATYGDQASNGSFRVTQVLVPQDDGLAIAGMHLSPIAAPPGRPPAS